jgi:anti-sigma B factor antagonist
MRMQEPDARLDVERLGPSAVVVRVAGEVDAATGPLVRSAIWNEVRQKPQRLIIDLTGVTFFGTAGVHILVELHKLRPDAQLVCKNRLVLRVLEITALLDLLAINGSTAEALTAPLDAD